MSSWKDSVFWSLSAGALLLAVPALGSAETFENLPDGVAASHPSTVLPAPPVPLPDLPAMHVAAGRGSFFAARPFFGPQASPISTFETEEGAAFRERRFSDRLLSSMNREARRYRSQNVSAIWAAALHGPADALDTEAESSRSEAASRVIVRSTRRALDEGLEGVARSVLGLGPTIDRLQSLSFRRTRAASSPDPAARRQPVPTLIHPAFPARPRADVGLRLDAHPALLLRAQFRSLRARLEVPALDDPLRLYLEAPVGSRGRALLTSSRPRDGQGRTTLVFTFGF